jgi:hypothetical protein
MQSPNQVPRVLRTILALKIGDDQRKRLLAAFAVSLDRISGGDRAFGALESILVPAHTPEISGTPMFLTALRAYIARHVSGPRCTDHLKVVFTDSVIRINALAYKVDPGAAWLKPISVDEAKPAKDDGTYPPQRPWASKRASDVLAALRWLDHGDTDPPVKLTPEQRKSQEWNDHFNDLLKLIEGWKVEEENSPEEYLINVALTYGLVAADAPPGAQKENVMGRYLNFLETRYAETANRNLWFAQVEALLRQAHYQREGADRAWILDHFARSASPIIALYGKIEEMLGPAKR